MKKESGFRRLTLVMSILAGIITLVQYLTSEETTSWRETWVWGQWVSAKPAWFLVGDFFIGLVGKFFIGFASVWVFYFFIKYIALRVVGYITKGFKGEDN